MSIRGVVFDLDGTLLNSLADIANAANAVLGEIDQPTHGVASYRRFVGGGVRVLFRRALSDGESSDALLDHCVELFKPQYEQTWHVESRLYDGIRQLLDELVDRGYLLGVLSNKPHEFTAKCVDHFLSDYPFDFVLGQQANVPPKPDPTGIRQIARQMNVSTEELAYIGDSDVDMQTGRTVGALTVGVAWGFRDVIELVRAGADAIIERPQDLMPHLDM